MHGFRFDVNKTNLLHEICISIISVCATFYWRRRRKTVRHYMRGVMLEMNWMYRDNNYTFWWHTHTHTHRIQSANNKIWCACDFQSDCVWFLHARLSFMRLQSSLRRWFSAPTPTDPELVILTPTDLERFPDSDRRGSVGSENADAYTALTLHTLRLWYIFRSHAGVDTWFDTLFTAHNVGMLASLSHCFCALRFMPIYVCSDSIKNAFKMCFNDVIQTTIKIMLHAFRLFVSFLFSSFAPITAIDFCKHRISAYRKISLQTIVYR